MSTKAVSAALRCAAHPGRPAHDRCPHCGRPRCAADAEAGGVLNCAVCRHEAPIRRPAGWLELVVRAGLACLPAVLIGGWITAEYVEVHIFSWIGPGLLGLATSWSAAGGVARARTPWILPVAVSAIAALLGTALGFRLYPHGPHLILHPLDLVGWPYVGAVVGTLVWPLIVPRPKDAGSSSAG